MTLTRLGGWTGALGILLLTGGCQFDTTVGSTGTGGQGGQGNTQCEEPPPDDGCNECSCEDGEWVCTLMACASGGSGARPSNTGGRSGGSPTECEPGDTRPADDGCNTCGCTDDGQWACTLMACGTGGAGGATLTECTPGETRRDDDGCNTCSCDDGGRWMCTLMECALGGTGGTTPTECETGDTRPAGDGCNTCRCDDDGRWGCTEMACATGGAGGATPLECIPGDTRRDDDGCNTCSCDDDGRWMCTLMGCASGGAGGATPTECEPGDSRPADDGCNTCGCTDDGQWACTLMLCATGGAGGAAPTECAPGEMGFDRCNACTCTDEGQWACDDAVCPECTAGETTEDPRTCTHCVCDEAGLWSCERQDDCVTPACPEPREPPADTACREEEVTAKDPVTGQCCQYATSCHAPLGWEYYANGADCEAEQDPVCPEPIPYSGGCIAVIAWGRSPTSGLCCQFPTPCNVPDGWQTFTQESECAAAENACGTTDVENTLVSVENTFGECLGSCRWLLEVTQTDSACNSVSLTVSGWNPDDPTYTNLGVLTPAGHNGLNETAASIGDAPLEDTYGCPDCADGGATEFVIRRGGSESTHRFEYLNAPPELAEVDTVAQEILDGLRSCQSNDLVTVDPQGCTPAG